MIERRRFGCPSCGALWTPPLRELPAWLDARTRRDACAEAPVGTWVRRPCPRGRPEHPVAVNIDDGRGLALHEDYHRTQGCCGVGHRERLPNLRCQGCGAEAAYRLSDGNHCSHAFFLPEPALITEQADEPSDDELRERFEARLGCSEPPLDDAGFDGLRPRFDSEAARWVEDAEAPAVFPTLRDLQVRLRGLEVRLELDGLLVRPPWPDDERDRLLALGALARGRPEETVAWWSTLSEGDGARSQHEWRQWCVGDELCVTWERRRGTSGGPQPVIAFRLPWELWELAWREALRAS